MNELLTMLDTKYKRLEYIQSTGTQYIDTGIVGKGTTTFHFKYQSANNNAAVFGARLTSTSRNLSFVQLNSSPYGRFDYLRSGSSGLSALGNTINEIRSSIDSENNNYNVNNITSGGSVSYTLSTFTTPYSIKLFARDNNGTVDGVNPDCKIYYFKIYDNGTLVRNFIPVLRKSDNEIGMLDLVEGKFYGNAGTGKFTTNLDTMYALIQGTPTVQDGRASNFSNNNYLKIPKITITDNTTYEMKIKFSYVSSSSVSTICGGGENSLLIANILSSRKIRYTALPIISSQDGTHILESGKTYYLKFVFDKTSYIIYLSEDDVNWEIDYEYTNSTGRNIEAVCEIGRNSTISGQFYRGNTIDLNRSYIKIDDTKYKLQAVVGYTVVGSPTIVDGVVSGFSSSNYLTYPVFDSIKQAYNKNFEIRTKIEIGTVSHEEQIIQFKYKGVLSGLTITNSKKLKWYIYGGTTTLLGTTIFNSLDTIYIKAQIKNNIATLYSSIDNITWLIEGYAEIGSITPTDTSTTGYIGVTSNLDNSYSFTGKIYLNETIIKGNNKLYFNGQQS